MSSTKKFASLNPNAVEFVPHFLRSPSGRTSTAAGATSSSVSGASVKSVLNRSESSTSNHSDEEFQLPDDITPDFRVMQEDGSQGISSIHFSTLALHEGNQTSRISSSTGSSFFSKERYDLSPHGPNGSASSDKIRYSVPSYGDDAILGNFLYTTAKPWESQILNNDQIMALVGEGSAYNGNSTKGLLNEATHSDNTPMNPLEFLVSQFPNFASESLAQVYLANSGDLNLTIEMLTQLELQVDSGLSQNFNSKASSAPNLSAMDFPPLSVQEGLHMFNSSSNIAARGAVDFTTALRKMPRQDGSIWKFDSKGSVDASVGSRSSNVLASSYNGGQGRGIYGERGPSRGASRAAPVWFDTGEALANMYTEMRDEARDHARLRNAYFEQARQAYIIGNKPLAKELSVKGQLHNLHMKAAQAKVQESIYHHRNPVGAEMQSNNGRGQEKIIDLHGLHVNEAIHVLKCELEMLRSAARSTEQRLHVYIYVGTGHHIRGSRTPARLPNAIQKYLLEDEGLNCTEPQPGLLRVLVY